MGLFNKLFGKKLVNTNPIDKIDKEYLEIYRKELELERKRLEKEREQLAEDARIRAQEAAILRMEEEEIKEAIMLSPTVFDYKKVSGGYSVTLNDKKFSKLKNLTRLIVPDNYKGEPVVNINKMGVNSYEHIRYVTIPKSIVSVNAGAFLWLDNLKRVHYLGTIDDWAQIEFGDGEANPLRKRVPLYIDGDFVTSVNLTTAKKIGNYAFYGCYGIETVKIPHGLTTIGDGAFALTTKINFFDFSESVTTIGKEAFKMASLGNTYFPSSLKRIEANAFKDCKFDRVCFMDRFNWWTTHFNEKVKLSSEHLSDSKVCTNYLTNKYCSYAWFKQ